MYFIYSLLMTIAALVLAPYWLVQGLRHGKYFSNLRERLGLAYPISRSSRIAAIAPAPKARFSCMRFLWEKFSRA